MWPEVKQAKDENRRELKLHGAEISERISSDGFDQSVFTLESLNLLNISDTSLTEIPSSISNLTNLQTLLLYGNEIAHIPDSIVALQKLKVLDISRNKLQSVPNAIAELASLTTLNLSNNQLTEFPKLENSTKLTVIDLSLNKLTEFPSICFEANAHLAEINFKENQIDAIPHEIFNLPSLKQLILVNNKIKKFPKCLSEMSKLKDVEFGENPVADKRLLKLIQQCRSKQVLDYIKQHGEDRPKSENVDPNATKTSGGKSKKGKSKGDISVEKMHKINVLHHTDLSPKIVVDETVKDVRPFIRSCIVRNVNLQGDKFRKFLQIQTKLHDTVCGKREKSTIATHDLNKLPGDEPKTVRYTAKEPKKLQIHPLGKLKKKTALKLYDDLKAEAEALRKEKKRNVYSGIHKYLYLLEGKTLFACIEDALGNIISLPPLTNGESTKISAETSDILVEVTSSTSANDCRATIEELLMQMLINGFGDDVAIEPTNEHRLIVQQIKIVDEEGNLKNVYPSKTDLQFDESANIHVERE